MKSTLPGGYGDLTFLGVNALASVMLIILELLGLGLLPTCMPEAHIFLDWGWAEVT